MKVAIIDEGSLYDDAPINFAKQVYLASRGEGKKYVLKHGIYVPLMNTLNEYIFRGQEKGKTLQNIGRLYNMGLQGKKKKSFSDAAARFERSAKPRSVTLQLLRDLSSKGYELFLRSDSPKELVEKMLESLEKEGIKFADYTCFDIEAQKGIFTGKARQGAMEDKLNGRSVEWEKSLLVSSRMPEPGRSIARAIAVYPDQELYGLAKERKWGIYPDHEDLIKHIAACRTVLRQAWVGKRRRGITTHDWNGVYSKWNTNIVFSEQLANEMPDDVTLQQNSASARDMMNDYEAGRTQDPYGVVMKLAQETCIVPSLAGKKKADIEESARRFVQSGLPLYAYAVALFKAAGEGRYNFLCSTTLQETLEAIKSESQFKFDRVDGLKAAVINGAYTGQIEAYPADDKGKALDEVIGKDPTISMDDSMAITNTLDDVGTLKRVKFKIGVNPEKPLREWLAANGGYAWPPDEKLFLASLEL